MYLVQEKEAADEAAAAALEQLNDRDGEVAALGVQAAAADQVAKAAQATATKHRNRRKPTSPFGTHEPDMARSDASYEHTHKLIACWVTQQSCCKCPATGFSGAQKWFPELKFHPGLASIDCSGAAVQGADCCVYGNFVEGVAFLVIVRLGAHWAMILQPQLKRRENSVVYGCSEGGRKADGRVSSDPRPAAHSPC